MDSGGAASKKAKRLGRPPKLTPEQVETLTSLVRENPLLSLDDLVWSFRRRTGITISTATARKYLLDAGLERKRPERTTRQKAGASSVNKAAAGEGEPQPKNYGYREAHRDAGDADRYPCGLTDSEWEQVRYLFDPPGKTGRPPKYSRRHMLDACVYVLRSGCSWRMLPKDFPPWPVVYRTFRRWLAQDLFQAMYDELRKLWRSRERRDPDPTAAILDSQSVKTSAQGQGSEAASGYRYAGLAAGCSDHCGERSGP